MGPSRPSIFPLLKCPSNRAQNLNERKNRSIKKRNKKLESGNLVLLPNWPLSLTKFKHKH
uniref:Uncharacterized protein n=1 Tax=Rhizophora mucronata TaxID=61149 RepID=A0A2P2JIV0_RHIMU